MATGKILGALYYKVRTFVTIIIAAAVCISSSGCYFLPEAEKAVSAPALEEAEDISQKIVEVRKGVIERVVTCSGMFLYNKDDLLRKNESGRAYFRLAGGYIKRMHVTNGSRVKKGDILAELETGNLAQQLSQQKGAVLRAEIALKQLKTQGTAEKQLEEMRLKQLKKQYAMLDLQNITKVEKSELEDSIKRQELKLDRLQQLYGSEDGNSEGYAVVQAEANLDSARLQLAELEEKKKDSVLYAPASGDVTFALKNHGFVQPYDTVVYIADSSNLIFQYTGDRASLFKLALPAEITANVRKEQDGKPEYEPVQLKGEVIQIPQKAQFIGDNPKLFIRISVPDLPESVRPGDTGEATVVVSRAEDAIIIPSIALKKNGTRRYVYVLKEGMVEERDVKAGISNSTEIQILDGLKEGEKVVLK